MVVDIDRVRLERNKGLVGNDAMKVGRWVVNNAIEVEDRVTRR
jgi:hypothetical protein